MSKIILEDPVIRVMQLERENEKLKKQIENIDCVKLEYNTIMDKLQKSHETSLTNTKRMYEYMENDIKRLKVSDNIIRKLYIERNALKVKVEELEDTIKILTNP